MNNFDEKINYLLAEIDRLTSRVRLLEKEGSVVVDDELKDSPNAIQNGAVFSALLSKADASALSSHADDANNPHAVTKSQVGLSDADNTADSVKSVLSASKLSTARTIAGVSFDGSANIDLPFANLSNKPTTLSGYGILDAAKIDASNLSSENLASWQGKLQALKMEEIWTGSLVLGQTLSIDFSPYSFLMLVTTTTSNQTASKPLFFDFLTTSSRYAAQIIWFNSSMMRFAEISVDSTKKSLKYDTGSGLTLKKLYGVL